MRKAVLAGVILLVMMVAMGEGYERRGRRRRTTTLTPNTTPSPDFDEMNVVKFNRNRWRQDEQKDEDSSVDSSDADDNKENFFSIGNNGNSNNWLTGVFDGLFDENTSKDSDSSVEDEKKDMFSMSNFQGSLFPSSIFIDSNLNYFPSTSSLGPNMCHKRHSEQHRSRDAFNGFMSTSCSFINGDFQCNQSSNRNGVTRRVINRWVCCEGFSKDPSMKGCPIVEKETILECLEYNNMTEFITALTTFQLSAYLTGENGTEFTILAPDDHALKEYEKDLDQHTGNVLEITPEMEEAASQIKDRLLSHILPTTLSITDFTTAKKVQTVLNDSHVFLFRHSLNRVQLSDLDVSVNCKPLEPVYLKSMGGRVYTLKGFLNPLRKTFNEILQDQSNAAEFLKLMSSLNDSDVVSAGQTVFVPSDRAFEGLGEWVRERINNKPLDFIMGLTAKYPLCPHQFDFVTAIKTLSGDLINISKEDDVVKFGSAVLEGSERVSKEGTIVYFIDSFPNAESLLQPSELVKTIGSTQFSDLMKANNFQEARDGHFSIVAPSNEALEELKESDDVARLLKYHTIVSPIHESGLLETDDEKQVYYKRFLLRGQMRKMLQCVPLKEHNTPLGYTVFSAERVLPQTEGTLLEILQKEERFSKFLELVKYAEMEDVLENTEHRFTLLAVDNQVFSELPASVVRRLQRSRTDARSVIMNHLLTTDFCMNDPADEFMVPLQTYRQRFVQWVAKEGEVKVAGKALRREESDRMASNGVLHVIEGLLLQSYTPSFYFTFFDV